MGVRVYINSNKILRDGPRSAHKLCCDYKCKCRVESQEHAFILQWQNSYSINPRSNAFIDTKKTQLYMQLDQWWVLDFKMEKAKISSAQVSSRVLIYVPFHITIYNCLDL